MFEPTQEYVDIGGGQKVKDNIRSIRLNNKNTEDEVLEIVVHSDYHDHDFQLQIRLNNSTPHIRMYDWNWNLIWSL